MNRQTAEEKEAVVRGTGPFVRNPITQWCDEVADLQEWNPSNILEE